MQTDIRKGTAKQQLHQQTDPSLSPERRSNIAIVGLRIIALTILTSPEKTIALKKLCSLSTSNN